MAETCFVPWPSPGTGGCPCGEYPDPCGSVGECLPQTQPPAINCFPPAATCRALGNCTTCEWISPAGFQICPGGPALSSPLVLLVAGAGAALGLVLALHKHPVNAGSAIGPRR